MNILELDIAIDKYLEGNFTKLGAFLQNNYKVDCGCFASPKRSPALCLFGMTDDEVHQEMIYRIKNGLYTN